MVHNFNRLLSLLPILVSGLLVRPAVGMPAPIEGNAALSVDNSGVDNRAINDWEFARMMRSLLVDQNGHAKARSAIFLFDTCYGAGMLDDLSATFAATDLKWVAGAAGSPGQNAFGQDSQREFEQKLAIAQRSQFPPPYKAQVLTIADSDELTRTFVSREPLGTWTRALLPAMTNPDATVMAAIQDAFRNDLAGINASSTVERFLRDIFGQPLQIGSVASGNAGDALKLSDPAAKSAHALLWSGLDNKARFDASKNAMQTMLTEQWAHGGIPSVSFEKLGNAGGRGARPATRDELTKALATIAAQLSPDETFLFYASGHGEPGRAQPAPQRLPAGQQSLLLDIAQEELAMLNLYQSSPYIDIAYSGLTERAAVALNGHSLGNLIPAPDANEVQRISFQIPLDWMRLHNYIDFFVGETGLALASLDFFTGPCCDFTVAVDEPPALALWLIVLASTALGIRLRRRARAWSGAGHPSHPTRAAQSAMR